MASENYVLERITLLIGKDLSATAALDLARQIMRTLQAGDDLGNGLRAIPIGALEELSAILDRNSPRNA